MQNLNQIRKNTHSSEAHNYSDRIRFQESSIIQIMPSDDDAIHLEIHQGRTERDSLPRVDILRSTLIRQVRAEHRSATA